MNAQQVQGQTSPAAATSATVTNDSEKRRTVPPISLDAVLVLLAPTWVAAFLAVEWALTTLASTVRLQLLPITPWEILTGSGLLLAGVVMLAAWRGFFWAMTATAYPRKSMLFALLSVSLATWCVCRWEMGFLQPGPHLSSLRPSHASVAAVVGSPAGVNNGGPTRDTIIAEIVGAYTLQETNKDRAQCIICYGLENDDRRGTSVILDVDGHEELLDVDRGDHWWSAARYRRADGHDICDPVLTAASPVFPTCEHYRRALTLLDAQEGKCVGIGATGWCANLGDVLAVMVACAVAGFACFSFVSRRYANFLRPVG